MSTGHYTSASIDTYYGYGAAANSSKQTPISQQAQSTSTGSSSCIYDSVDMEDLAKQGLASAEADAFYQTTNPNQVLLHTLRIHEHYQKIKMHHTIPSSKIMELNGNFRNLGIGKTKINLTRFAKNFSYMVISSLTAGIVNHKQDKEIIESEQNGFFTELPSNNTDTKWDKKKGEKQSKTPSNNYFNNFHYEQMKQEGKERTILDNYRKSVHLERLGRQGYQVVAEGIDIKQTELYQGAQYTYQFAAPVVHSITYYSAINMVKVRETGMRKNTVNAIELLRFSIANKTISENALKRFTGNLSVSDFLNQIEENPWLLRSLSERRDIQQLLRRSSIDSELWRTTATMKNSEINIALIAQKFKKNFNQQQIALIKAEKSIRQYHIALQKKKTQQSKRNRQLIGMIAAPFQQTDIGAGYYFMKSGIRMAKTGALTVYRTTQVATMAAAQTVITTTKLAGGVTNQVSKGLYAGANHVTNKVGKNVLEVTGRGIGRASTGLQRTSQGVRDIRSGYRNFKVDAKDIASRHSLRAYTTRVRAKVTNKVVNKLSKYAVGRGMLKVGGFIKRAFRITTAPIRLVGYLVSGVFVILAVVLGAAVIAAALMSFFGWEKSEDEAIVDVYYGVEYLNQLNEEWYQSMSSVAYGSSGVTGYYGDPLNYTKVTGEYYDGDGALTPYSDNRQLLLAMAAVYFGQEMPTKEDMQIYLQGLFTSTHSYQFDTGNLYRCTGCATRTYKCYEKIKNTVTGDMEQHEIYNKNGCSSEVSYYYKTALDGTPSTERKWVDYKGTIEKPKKNKDGNWIVTIDKKEVKLVKNEEEYWGVIMKEDNHEFFVARANQKWMVKGYVIPGCNGHTEVYCRGHVDAVIHATVNGYKEQQESNTAFGKDPYAESPMVSTDSKWQGWTKDKQEYAQMLAEMDLSDNSEPDHELEFTYQQLPTFETPINVVSDRDNTGSVQPVPTGYVPRVVSGYANSFGESHRTLTKEEINAILDALATSETRKAIIATALSAVGRIEYSQPGRAPRADWPDFLDCSSFISWCYWKNRIDIGANIVTAQMISNTSLFVPISQSQLQPGDILLKDSVIGQHVKLFVGWTTTGEALIIHCNNKSINEVTGPGVGNIYIDVASGSYLQNCRRINGIS